MVTSVSATPPWRSTDGTFDTVQKSLYWNRPQMCIIHKVFIFRFPGKEHSWHFRIIYMLILPIAHRFVQSVWCLLWLHNLPSLMFSTCDIEYHYISRAGRFCKQYKEHLSSYSDGHYNDEMTTGLSHLYEGNFYPDILLLKPPELPVAHPLSWAFHLYNGNSWIGVTVSLYWNDP